MILFVVYMFAYDCSPYLWAVHSTQEEACEARTRCERLEAPWQDYFANVMTPAPCYAAWLMAYECKGHKFDRYLSAHEAELQWKKCHPGRECRGPHLNLCYVQQTTLGVDDKVVDVGCPQPNLLELEGEL